MSVAPTTGTPVGLVEAHAPDAQRAPAAEKPTAGAGISGTVKDTNGRPVAGVEVWIVGTNNPFQGVEVDPFDTFDASLDDQIGRGLLTDASGSFAVPVPDGRMALVHLGTDSHYRPVVGDKSVQAPASDVELVLERFSSGKVAIQVYDVLAAEYLTAFRVEIRYELESTGDKFYATKASQLGKLNLEFPIPDDSGLRMTISLVQPASSQRVSREVLLGPNEVAEVQLAFQADHEVSGRVVDDDGAPVENALVFFGDRDLLQGGELCQDTREGRLVHGVRSNSDGWFTVTGCGAYVTASHPRHSTETVPWTKAEIVVLRDLSTVEGTVREPGGEGVEGVRLQLDEASAATTDGRGRFTFSSVDAGLHCLRVGEELYGVLVEPGSTLPVDVTQGAPSIRVRLQAGDRPYLEDFTGFVVALGSHAMVLPVTGSGGVLAEPLPASAAGGLLLGSAGQIARVKIEGSGAIADLGESQLAIEGPPGLKILLLPEDCADPVHFAVARRLAQSVPDTGRIVLKPLPHGVYWVQAMNSDKRVRAMVAAPGTTVSLQ